MNKKVNYNLLGLSFILGLPMQFFAIQALLRYVYTPPIILEILMYIGISIVIYELLKKPENWNRKDHFSLFVIYYFFLIYVLFARPDMGYAFYELNPAQLIHGIRYGSYDEWIVALFNILIFIPMPIIHDFYLDGYKKLFISSLCVGIGVEIIQALSHRGVFDVGDIILYCIGILISLLILWKMKKNV